MGQRNPHSALTPFSFSTAYASVDLRKPLAFCYYLSVSFSLFFPAIDQLAALLKSLAVCGHVVVALTFHIHCCYTKTTVQVLAFEALTTAMKGDHTARIISASDSE